MALKTNVPEQTENAQLEEQEIEDFFQRLDQFRDSLPEKEQVMLAALVVEATGKGEEADKAQQENPKSLDPPTDEEFDAFAEKLNQFHDSLEGDQHLVLDAMLGKTWFQHEAEVEGFYWRLLDTRVITNRQLPAYINACGAVGGDRVTWVRRMGGGHRRVACWDWA
jgi:hypothetical protein